MPYCPECGTEVEYGDAFCATCGAELSSVSRGDQPPGSIAGEGRSDTRERTAAPSGGPPPSQSRDTRRRAILKYAGGLGIVAAGGAGGAWYVFLRDDGEEYEDLQPVMDDAQKQRDQLEELGETLYTDDALSEAEMKQIERELDEYDHTPHSPWDDLTTTEDAGNSEAVREQLEDLGYM